MPTKSAVACAIRYQTFGNSASGLRERCDSCLQLIVPSFSQRWDRQGDIDVWCDAQPFHNRAAPGIPASRRQTKNIASTDREIRAAKHLATGPRANQCRQRVLFGKGGNHFASAQCVLVDENRNATVERLWAQTLCDKPY